MSSRKSEMHTPATLTNARCPHGGRIGALGRPGGAENEPPPTLANVRCPHGGRLGIGALGRPGGAEINLAAKLLSPLRRPGMGPVARVVVGLVALSVCIALIADLAFNLFRDDEKVAREIRKRVSENVAIQLAVLAQSGDRLGIEKTVAGIINREHDVVSIGLRQAAGELIYASPGHLTTWRAPEGGKSTLTHVEVPLFAGGKDRWGQIEISFRPVGATGWLHWVQRPAVLMTGALLILGGLGYFIYMRRVLAASRSDRRDPGARQGRARHAGGGRADPRRLRPRAARQSRLPGARAGRRALPHGQEGVRSRLVRHGTRSGPDRTPMASGSTYARSR